MGQVLTPARTCRYVEGMIYLARIRERLQNHPVTPSEPGEVAAAFWFPLADLCDPARRREAIYSIQGRERSHPADVLYGALEHAHRGSPRLAGRVVATFLPL